MDNYQYGDKYSPFLYDAVKLYAIAINETLVNKEDPYNGHDIAARMRGKSFQGKYTWWTFDSHIQTSRLATTRPDSLVDKVTYCAFYD